MEKMMKSNNKPITTAPAAFQHPKHPQLVLQQTLTTIQQNFSSFLGHVAAQNPSSLKTHLHSALSRLQAHAAQALNPSVRSHKSPAWARMVQPIGGWAPKPGLSAEDIKERLEGVPVYGISNADDEFVLVSCAGSSEKNLSLFCFKKEDAEALLQEITSMEPDSGTRVVPVPLSQVFKLKVDGVAFRLIPDTFELKNAIKMKESEGLPSESFWGVPVFQARSLLLKSNTKSYRPAFFKKEDLEKSLRNASDAQGKPYPSDKGEIQVAVFEDVIRHMKGKESEWSDTVFVPPGYDFGLTD